MSDWARPSGAGRFASTGPAADSKGGISFQVGATPHVKSGWQQVFASAPFAVAGFTFFFQYVYDPATATNSQAMLVDIGIGPSGSEVVLVANLQVSGTNNNVVRCGEVSPLIPLSIPAGTRIAIRAQCNVGNCYLVGGMMLHGAAWLSPLGFGQCTTYGADTANSRGTLVQCPADNTKGSLYELTAAVTAPVRGIILATGGGGEEYAGFNEWNIDVAVGAAGSEAILLPDVQNTAGTHPYGYTGMLHWSELFLVDIPAGTRISVRHRAEVALRPDQFCMVHCFN